MFAIGLAGFGITSALCGLAPTMELLILFRRPPGGRRRDPRAGFAGDPDPDLRGRGARPRLRHLGRRIGRDDAPRARSSAALLVDLVSWRLAFLINVPLVHRRALRDAARHLPEHRAAAAHRATSTGWARSSLRSRSAACRSGRSAARSSNWQDPIAFVALAVGIVAAVAFPFLMARSTHPLVPLWLFRSRNFSVTNLSTLLIYGALYVFSLLPLAVRAGHDRLHGVGRRARRASRRRSSWCSSRRVSAASPPGYGPRVFMAVGPRDHGRRAPVVRRGSRPTARRGSSDPSRPGDAHSRRAAISSTCCRASCCSGSG